MNREEEVTGDDQDVSRVTKKILNRAASKRLISKQEACVLLGNLDLTLCSETIENVSISNSKPLQVSLDSKKSSKKFIDEYKKRPRIYEEICLHYYFIQVRNYSNNKRKNQKFIIPNFIGVSGSPCYPVSIAYAKHNLICYQAWREYPKNIDWIHEFNQFINDPEVPKIAKIPYERALLRYVNKTQYCDPKATPSPTGGLILPEHQEVIDLYGMHEVDDPDYDLNILRHIDRGLNYEWDKKPMVNLLVA